MHVDFMIYIILYYNPFSIRNLSRDLWSISVKVASNTEIDSKLYKDWGRKKYKLSDRSISKSFHNQYQMCQ